MLVSDHYSLTTLDRKLLAGLVTSGKRSFHSDTGLLIVVNCCIAAAVQARFCINGPMPFIVQISKVRKYRVEQKCVPQFPECK